MNYLPSTIPPDKIFRENSWNKIINFPDGYLDGKVVKIGIWHQNREFASQVVLTPVDNVVTIEFTADFVRDLPSSFTYYIIVDDEYLVGGLVNIKMGTGDNDNSVTDILIDGDKITFVQIYGNEIISGLVTRAETAAFNAEDNAEQTGEDRTAIAILKGQTDTNVTATSQDRAAVVVLKSDVTQLKADTNQIKSDTNTIKSDTVVIAGQVAADKVVTGQDRVQTGLDRIATAADRVQTGVDKAATASDRVQTGLDVASTLANKDAAALSADAAKVNSKIFGTIAEALASTTPVIAVGDNFQVQGSGDVASNLYKRTSTTPFYVFVSSYPSGNIGAKVTAITTVTPAPDNLITGTTSGYWATAAASSADITTASTLKHTNLIPISTGDILILEGVGSGTLALSTVGKRFGSDGVTTGTFGPGTLISISGGYKYTVPTVAAGTVIGFNLANADTVKIYKSQSGLVISDLIKINTVALPTPKTDLGEFTNSAGYAKTVDTVTNATLFDVAAVPANLAVTSSGYWSGSGVTNISSITPSAGIYHITPIGCDVGNTFAIKGLTTSLSLGAMGRFFDSAGNVVSPAISLTHYSDILGGKMLTVPNIVGVAFFGINVNLVDVAGLTIQAGGEIITVGKKTVKTTLLPVTTTSDNSDALALSAFNRGTAVKSSTIKKYGLLMLGQSNMDGRVDNTEQPQWFIDLGRVITGALFCNNANGTFANYAVSAGVQFSFELFLYKLLLDYLKTKYSDSSYNIYSVKRAQGGTPISKNVSGTPSGYWNAFTENVPSGNVLISETETRIRKALEMQGTNFSVRAVVWHQGESDGSGTAPSEYYKNLKCVIAYIRGVLDNPKLPFVIGGINNKSTQYNATVNAASRQLAVDVPFVYYAEVTNDTAHLKSDILHFNALGAEELAMNVFNIIKDF